MPNQESDQFRRLTMACLALSAFCGCSFGPKRVEVPQIDAAAAATAAMKQYDANGDLSISKSESCPAMEGAFELYDANHDGGLSQAEVQTRLEAMLGSGIGRMPCMCIVYANNRDQPIEGAKVEFVPEAFLGDAIQPGAGITNHRGVAKPVTLNAPPGLPGIEFGLYRVRITHDELEIPARYNTETELGFELSPLERNRDTAEFRLKLR